jgi:DNA-binding transcriptional LysR family regulator
MESANVELSYLYAAQGLGIAFASVVEGFPLQQRRQVVLLPLDDFFPPEWLVVVWRRQPTLASHKAAFLEMLSEEVRDGAVYDSDISV